MNNNTAKLTKMTLETKYQIIQDHKQHKLSELSKAYNLPISTISTIVNKDSAKIISSIISNIFYYFLSY